ncbi:MAG TPA: hypothetical protein VK745_32300 [Polyangiaceae bacterium]|nr:hypothetical protein [Polyangiaceae bacterium]
MFAALAGLAFPADCGGSAFTATGSAGGGGAGGSAGHGGSEALGGDGNAGGQSSAGTSSGGQTGRAGSASGGAGASAGSGGVAGASGGASGAAGRAGAAGTAGAGGMPISACPTTPPTGACVAGLKCTYGDDLRLMRRSHYECSNGRFVEDPSAACVPLENCFMRDGGAATDRSACPTLGEECSFDAGTDQGMVYCRCEACPTGNCAATWNCVSPPAKPCPLALPNIGQPCSATSKRATTVFAACRAASPR